MTSKKTLPTEIILLIATYMPLEDQESLVQVIPGIENLFTIEHYMTPRDNEGNTILHLYAQHLPFDLPAHLNIDDNDFLAASIDADPHVQNNYGATPLIYAAGGDYVDVVTHYLPGRPPDLQLMQQILDKDPTGINIRADENKTALHYAINGDHEESVALLLTVPGIDVNCRDDWHNETPMLRALDLEHRVEEIIESLLNHPDMDLRLADDNGNTPLMRAAAGFSLEGLIRQMLRRNDCYVNATNRDGRTALHIAVDYGLYENVEVLLTHDGIEYDRPDNNGTTPFMEARGNSDIMNLFFARGEIDINHRDRDGRTVLSHVAENGSVESAQILIDHGARLDINDNDGYLPIDRAAESSDVDMVDYLGAMGIDCGCAGPRTQNKT
ncbi:ankyrin repeat domain-containing protein [Aspergillus undulatus]|uniref:ankyrin repeat domain-containing protein n=1 Tax=Aspergillus undulatus TaxID=1810928 RepID=UPI003CCD4BE4